MRAYGADVNGSQRVVKKQVYMKIWICAEMKKSNLRVERILNL